MKKENKQKPTFWDYLFYPGVTGIILIIVMIIYKVLKGQI